MQVSKERQSGTAGRFRRWEWGKQIKEGQPAYAWGRFITPLYGIKVVGFLADMTYSVGSLPWNPPPPPPLLRGPTVLGRDSLT